MKGRKGTSWSNLFFSIMCNVDHDIEGVYDE